MFQTTSLDIWRKETSSTRIITLCKLLDKYLGNGIAAGIITEFSGRAGSGKTQMCLQVCLTVQFTGRYKAVFIDTNQGFNPFRLTVMAEHCAKRMEKIDPRMTADSFMENITYIYCNEYVMLLAKLQQTIDRVKADPLIKLIVIDSFSYIFRNFKSTTERIRITYQILTDLQVLAENHNLVVIITNELTTRILSKDEKVICPALGDSHSHKVGQRIVLTKDSQGIRYAYLDKTFHSQKIGIPFEIRDSGIGGCRLE